MANTKTETVEPKPEDKVHGERGWLNIEFDGFNPEDSNAALFRRWLGLLTAQRSDGVIILIQIIHLQKDTPMKIGLDFTRAFEILETFRNCQCQLKSPCALHRSEEFIHAGPAAE